MSIRRAAKRLKRHVIKRKKRKRKQKVVNPGSERSDAPSKDSENHGIPKNPKETILENWEKYTNDILIRLFFSRPEPADIETLDDICQYVIFSQEEEERQKFADLVIEMGFIEVLERALKISVDQQPNLQQLNCLLRITVNCTDISTEFCKTIVSRNSHNYILDSLRTPIFHQMGSSAPISDLQEQTLTILYNILRNIPEVKQKLREDGIIEVAVIHLKSNEPTVKTLALFVISFAADISSDKELIKATSSNIKFILESCLRPAMHSRNHEADGWSLEEILEALSLLSQNAKNAVEMANLGLLNIFTKLLEQEMSESEVKSCFDILWSMTFVEDLRNRIRRYDKLLAQVEKQKHYKNDEIVKSAAGIQWNLEHLDEVTSSRKLAEGEHIMISYCWAQKSLAWLISQKLNEDGKKVWIDTRNMQGDVFDAMAEAVEKATHVLCCISEAYTSSRFCRLEAVHAWKKKKNLVFVRVQEDYEANGWLGLIMSGAFYYEMYTDKEIERNFGKFLAYLDNRTSNSKDSSEKTKLLQTKPVNEKSMVHNLECSKKKLKNGSFQLAVFQNKKTRIFGSK